MNNRHLYLLAGSLSVAGLLLFLYKLLVLGFPLVQGDVVPRWILEARLHFVAKGGPVKVALAVPSSTRRALLVDERFVSRGFGLTMKRDDSGRQVIWSRRQEKGEQVLYYRATVQLTDDRAETAPGRPAPPVPPTDLGGPELAAALAVLDEVRAQSADTETLVGHLVKRLAAPAADPNAALLVGERPEARTVVPVAARVLALAGLAARTAWGLQLFGEPLHGSPEPWLQVFEAGGWVTFHPVTGEMGMPADLVVVGYGAAPFVSAEGARAATVQWTVRKSQEAALAAALERGRLLSREFIDFSLFSLPLETQQVFRVLLLIPLGALLLAVLRNVIGIKTFGTFMPVLIALAFRETQLPWGIALFVVLVGLGLAVRFYLENLKLLLVPRLSSLLILVVMMMAVVTVLSHKLGLQRGLSVGLFPMVIMTMTIERMSIVWDERGAAEALQQGVGSLLAAVLGYLVMFNPWAEHLVFVFPELLLILLAGSLLLGRYSGYRLTELGRFKVLAREAP